MIKFESLQVQAVKRELNARVDALAKNQPTKNIPKGET